MRTDRWGGDVLNRLDVRTAALLAAALVITLAISTRGITDEGAGSLQGDMPRYLMNGALAHDFLVDGGAWSVSGVLDYANRYYARYPALSLGHHPPLLPMLLVPAYVVFGPSVLAGRVVITLCALAAVWLLFLVGRRLYDEQTAAWSALLFATVPYLAEFSQSVMSEFPTLACVLLALHFLLRFRETAHGRDYALFMLAATISLLSKQTAILLLPVHLVLLLDRRGRALLRRPRVFGATVGIGIAVLTVAAITVVVSPFNVRVVADAFLGRHELATMWRSFDAVVRWQTGYVLAVVVGLAGIVGVLRRTPNTLVGLTWIAGVLGGAVLLIGPWDIERYTVIAVPAYCLLVASLMTSARPGLHKWAATAVVVFTLAWQGVAVAEKHPVGADGYERVAQYVLAAQRAPTVLFSGSVDTGYFVFFLRKHDVDRRMVVLRADKLLTTSLMGSVSVEDRIHDTAEVYPLLRRFGTRFIVIEDRPSGSAVLDGLRDELKGPRFSERLRVPVGTSDRRLRGVSLVVYEYNQATTAALDATIDINVPLVGRHVAVPLAELTRGGPSIAGAAPHPHDDRVDVD